MVFHIIGTACIAITMGTGIVRDSAGNPVKPVCQELKGAADYATYTDCWKALKDPAQIPALPPARVVVDSGIHAFVWYPSTGPHCIQE